MNGAPIGVWGIEMAIRGLASELDWKPVPNAVFTKSTAAHNKVAK
jgi:hypothetical protein